MSASLENRSLVSGEYLVFGSKFALHEYHTLWVHSCASGFRVNSPSRNSRPGAERTSAAPVHSCSMQRRASPCAGLGRGDSRMRRGAGVPPAVARASCPCRFTAKMAVPQWARRPLQSGRDARTTEGQRRRDLFDQRRAESLLLRP
jgi:hypothetical protein